MADGGAPVDPRARLLPWDAFDYDPGNPRRSSPDEAIDLSDLLGPVRLHGILAPLLVERRGERFLVVDGERRHRAAGVVDRREDVPAIVLDDLDAEARLELQITSYARAPMTPLAEARAFKRLLDAFSPGFPGTAGTIADRLGVPLATVKRRLALLDLALFGQALLASGKITLGLAQETAGHSPAAQGALVVGYERVLAAHPTRAPLRRGDVSDLLTSQNRRLDTAPFPLDDASYPGGACNACPKRSSRQSELFDESPAGDVCHDKACHDKKAETWRGRRDDEQAERTVGPEKAKKGKAAREDAFKTPHPSPPVAPGAGRGEGDEEDEDETPLPKATPRGSAADDAKIERHAEEQARSRALAAIGKAFFKMKPDEKLWRLLASYVVRSCGVVVDGVLGEALEHRGLVPGKGYEDDRKLLLGWTAKAAIGDCAGLMAELLAAIDDTANDDDVYLLACRAAGVNPETLYDQELEKARAAAKPAEKPKGKTKAVTMGKTTAPPPPCSLTWPDIERLAKLAKFKPHSGAQSPENVWGCVERIRATFHGTTVATRQGLYDGSRSSGTDSVDLAILYLLEAAEIMRAGGKGPQERLVRVEPGQSSREAEAAADPETVHLDGEVHKATEVCACPKCKVKAGKVCVGPRGKLGTGWFHTERWRVSGGPAGAPDYLAPEQTTIPGSGPVPARPSLFDAVRRAHSVGKLDPAAIPPKAPPAEHAPRKCIGCGCTDGGACQDDHPTSEAGECTWEELAGDAPICSVCLRCALAAVSLCRTKRSIAVVTKALAEKQAGANAPEVWGKDRVAGVLAHLETTGALGRTVDKKLLAAQPVAG